MRYLDWDVLLFPSGEHVEDVNCPFREFKVQAQAERKGGDPTANLTPLVTAFVPSLQQDASFQISVHSWSRTEAFFTVGPDGRPARELWEVRVVVDGNLLSVTHLPVDAQWPQIVSEWSIPEMQTLPAMTDETDRDCHARSRAGARSAHASSLSAVPRCVEERALVAGLRRAG